MKASKVLLTAIFDIATFRGPLVNGSTMTMATRTAWISTKSRSTGWRRPRAGKLPKKRRPGGRPFEGGIISSSQSMIQECVTLAKAHYSAATMTQ